MIFEIFIILSFSFTLRFIFTLSTTSDNYWHLWQIKQIKKNGLGNHKVFNAIIPGYQAYPNFPHYLISKFPESKQIPAAYILNILYDCLSVIIFYFIVYFFQNKTAIFIEANANLPFLLTIFFSTTPIFFPVTARLKSIGARTFGGLLSLIYFVILGAGINYELWLYAYPLCIIIGILIIMSSQFAMQVIILFSITLSIFYTSINPFLIVLLSIIIGSLIPKTGIWEFWKYFKINHYLRYIKIAQKGTSASNRNRLKDFVYLPIMLFKNRGQFLNIVFKKNTFIILMYSVPQLMIFTYILLNNFQVVDTILGNRLTEYLFYILLSSVIVFLLTSLKPLLFLGQAERYLEYSVWSITLLLYYLFQFSGFDLYNLQILICLNISILLILFIFTQLTNYKKSLKGEEDSALIDLIDFLDTKDGSKVLSVPIKLSFGLAALSNNKDIYFYYKITANKIDGFKRSTEDEVWVNFIKPDFEYFVKEYSIDLFVFTTEAINQAKGLNIKYDLDNKSTVFENEKYKVYKASELI